MPSVSREIDWLSLGFHRRKRLEWIRLKSNLLVFTRCLFIQIKALEEKIVFRCSFLRRRVPDQNTRMANFARFFSISICRRTSFLNDPFDPRRESIDWRRSRRLIVERSLIVDKGSRMCSIGFERISESRCVDSRWRRYAKAIRRSDESSTGDPIRSILVGARSFFADGTCRLNVERLKTEPIVVSRERRRLSEPSVDIFAEKGFRFFTGQLRAVGERRDRRTSQTRGLPTKQRQVTIGFAQESFGMKTKFFERILRGEQTWERSSRFVVRAYWTGWVCLTCTIEGCARSNLKTHPFLFCE